MPFIRCNKSKPLAIAEPFNLSVTAFFFLINRYHCVFPSFHDISTSASKSLSANCTEVYKPAPLFSVNIQKNAGPIVRALDAGVKLFSAACPVSLRRSVCSGSLRGRLHRAARQTYSARIDLHTVFALAPCAISLKNALQGNYNDERHAHGAFKVRSSSSSIARCAATSSGEALRTGSAPASSAAGTGRLLPGADGSESSIPRLSWPRVIAR